MTHRGNESAPREIAVLMLEGRCTMRCPFCITEHTQQAMHWHEALWALDHMAARGGINVVLGGGEPLLWTPGIAALASEAKQRGLLVQVGTNALGLNARLATHPDIDRFVLPLESHMPAMHDAMRPYGGPSHHALMLKKLALLRAHAVEVTVSTVVTRRNARHLRGLADWLASYAQHGGRIHAWHLYRFVPEGRGGAIHAAELRQTRDAYDEACRPICSLGLPFQVFKRPDMRASRNVEFYWKEAGRMRIGSDVWRAAAQPA